MQNFIFVNMLQPHTYLDKELPYFFFLEKLFILLLEEIAKVSTFTKFHQDIKIIILNEWIVVAYYKRMLQLTHNMRFVRCLNNLWLLHFCELSHSSLLVKSASARRLIYRFCYMLCILLHSFLSQASAWFHNSVSYSFYFLKLYYKLKHFISKS